MEKLRTNQLVTINSVILFGNRAFRRHGVVLRWRRHAFANISYQVDFSSETYTFRVDFGSHGLNLITQGSILFSKRLNEYGDQEMSSLLEAFLDPFLLLLDNITGEEFTVSSKRVNKTPSYADSEYLCFQLLDVEVGVNESVLLLAESHTLPLINSAIERFMEEHSLKNIFLSGGNSLPVSYALGSTVMPTVMLKDIDVGDVLVIDNRYGLNNDELLIKIGTKLTFIAEITASGFRLINDGVNEAMTSDEGSDETVLDPYGDLGVRLDFEVGSAEITLSDLTSLEAGYVFSLGNTNLKAPIAIRCGARNIGTGELVSLDNERLGVILVAKDPNL